MNYIREMNAFYDWLEINELSPSAINLWYALMHINNKAGWAETFTVAESVLCVKTGLTDRTLRKVRNELKQKGRIDFTSRKGKAPIYKIISFERTENISVLKDNSENISEVSSGVSTEVSSGLGSEVSSALIKQNETKQEEEKENAGAENPYDVYQENFGMPRPAIRESIMMWCDDLNVDLVIAAIKLAAKHGWRSFTSIERVLNEWDEMGIKTVDHARQYETDKQKKKEVAAHGQTWRSAGKTPSQNGGNETPRSITGGQVGWIKPKRA